MAAEFDQVTCIRRDEYFMFSAGLQQCIDKCHTDGVIHGSSGYLQFHDPVSLRRHFQRIKQRDAWLASTVEDAFSRQGLVLFASVQFGTFTSQR